MWQSIWVKTNVMPVFCLHGIALIGKLINAIEAHFEAHWIPTVTLVLGECLVVITVNVITMTLFTN